MSIKFDIQLFSGGSTDWSAGVTDSAVDSALQEFDTKMDLAKTTLEDYDDVFAKLQAGWSGQDCEDFITKFKEHVERVKTEIDEYKEAVHGQADLIKEAWKTFQDGQIGK